MEPKKRPGKQEPPSRRAGKLIGQIAKLGGIQLQCGCFFAASAKDMRILLARGGATAVLDAMDGLETWHDCRSNVQK